MAIGGTAVLSLKAETARFTNQMQQAAQKLDSTLAHMKRSIDGLQKKMSGLQTIATGAFAALSGSLMVGAGAAAVKAFAAAEKSAVTLNATLRATGKFSEEASQKLQDHAAALQKVTTAEGDAVVAATAMVGMLSKGLSTDELEKSQRAVVALADAFEMDLNKAATLVGKSIGSNTNALKRYGITVDKNASQSEKLNQILEQTAVMFEVAQEKANTLEGQTIITKNVFEDLTETIGGVIAEGLNLQASFKDIQGMLEAADKSIQEHRAEWVAVVSTLKTVVLVIADLGAAVLTGVAFVVTGITDMMSKGSAAMEKAVNMGIGAINKMRELQKMTPMGAIQDFFGVGPKPMDYVDWSKPRGVVDRISDAAAGATLDLGSATRNIWGAIVNQKPGGMLESGSYTAKNVGGYSGGGGGGSKKAHHKADSYGGLLGLSTDLGWDLPGLGFKMIEKMNSDAQQLVEKYKEITTEQEKLTQSLLEMRAAGELAGDSQAEITRKMLILIGAEEEQIEIRTELNELDELRLQMSKEIHGDTTEMAKRQEILNQWLADGAIKTDQYNEAMKRLKDQFGPVKDKQQEMIDAMSQEIQRFGQEFETTLVDMLTGAEFSFKELANSFAEAVTRMIIHWTIIKPMFDAIGNFMNSGSGGSGGGFLSGIGKAIGGLFGGGDSGSAPLPEMPAPEMIELRAGGGPVRRGRSYIVGERRPELFTPDQNGFIYPHTGMGGGSMQPVVVEMTINAVDAASFLKLVGANRAVFENIALNATQKAYNKSGRYGPLDAARA